MGTLRAHEMEQVCPWTAAVNTRTDTGGKIVENNTHTHTLVQVKWGNRIDREDCITVDILIAILCYGFANCYWGSR